MSVSLQADRRAWLEIPRAFPTDDGYSAEQWEARVVDGMRDAWKGALDAPTEAVVREALRNGLSRVLPQDSITLQFWPGPAVANAIVHVVVGLHEDGEAPLSIPLDDGPFVVPPLSGAFHTEFLGAGVESRALSSIDSSPPMALGAVNYLFDNGDGYVFVGIDQTLPELVGVMLEPLRDIVRSIRVLDDDGRGPWAKATIDETTIAHHDETWTFDNFEGAASA